MKKVLLLSVIALLMCSVLSGCAGLTGGFADYSYSLNEQPVVNDLILELNGEKGVRINFELDKPGFIKLVTYDCTEYEIYPDEICESYVTFKDKNNKVLYKDIDVYNGYLDKLRFDAGDVIAEITFKNMPEDMAQIAVTWAYAEDTDAVVTAKIDEYAVAATNDNKQSKYKFSLDKDSLIRVMCAEAGLFESDCKFHISDADGNKVTGDLSIHGTEWTSRLVFLPKGDYFLTVEELEAVALCKISLEETYDNIVLDDKDGLSVPVTLGFTSGQTAQRTVSFTCTKDDKYLNVEAIGTGTFYDSEQSVGVVIKDSKGKIVLEEFLDFPGYLDISQLSGTYTVCVEAQGNCVVKIAVVNE